MMCACCCFVFFFQAEDGIRDLTVTGVQTCALPISYAVLDHGWPFAVLVAPLAMLVGDLGLRRLPADAALGNATHLTAGSAVAGLVYQRLGGVGGTGALAAANLAPLAAFLAAVPANRHDAH